MTLIDTGLDTGPLTLEPMWRVTFHAPPPDIDRIFDAICAVTGLEHGRTDRNGFRMPGGWEYYRPRAGTPTGAEEAVRKRPDVDAMTVFVPRDEAILTAVTDAIYRTHSYYEPVIIIDAVLRSATKGLDDSDNPHRWWNTTGDWKPDA